MTTFCDFCERAIPPGCRHLSGEFRECSLGPRTDLPWRVGMALWKDLTDRRGIKNELNACNDAIKVEIIDTLGRIALKEVGDSSKQALESYYATLPKEGG